MSLVIALVWVVNTPVTVDDCKLGEVAETPLDVLLSSLPPPPQAVRVKPVVIKRKKMVNRFKNFWYKIYLLFCGLVFKSNVYMTHFTAARTKTGVLLAEILRKFYAHIMATRHSQVAILTGQNMTSLSYLLPSLCH